MGASPILLLVSLTLLAGQRFVAAAPPVIFVDKWHIHVTNGLSSGELYVHCRSRDTDIGEFNLKQGAEIQWSFKENVWGTTLFWCLAKKPGASASFEVFWHEVDHFWLHYRCTKDGTCYWIVKDDGIYVKNRPDGVDDLVHKWSG